MKIRNVFLTLAAVAMFTVPALGESGSFGPAVTGVCACATDEAGAGVCLQDQSCPAQADCGPGGPACPAGMVCAIDTCCGFPTCLVPCPEGGICAAGGTCATGFPACEAAPVPTVSEWGLVVLTLIGFIAGTVLFGVARRRTRTA